MSSDSESDKNSFLWSPVSNDSSDFDMPEVQLKVKEKKSNHENSDDEKQVKNELLQTCNDTSSTRSSKHKKAKNKKIKQEPSDSEVTEPLDKKIKIELSSDVETTKKKKKKSKDKVKEENPNIISDDVDSSVNEAADESYLNLRVKEETFAKPNPVKKKKNKHSNNNESTSSINSCQTEVSKKNKKNKNLSFTEHSQSESEIENSSENNIKREPTSTGSDTDHSELSKARKKKKSKKDIKKDDPMIEDYFSAEETRVQSPVRVRTNSRNVSTSSVNNENNDTDNSWRKQLTSDDKDSHMNGHQVSDGESASSSTRLHPSSAQDNTTSTITNGHIEHTDSGSDSSSRHDGANSLMNVTAPLQNKQRRKRISERLIFEDEIELNSEQSKQQKQGAADLSVSFPMKQYFTRNNNLKNVTSNLSCDSIISQDDEVWLLKCPHEITLDYLGNVNFAFESKCKVKVNEQTYEGHFENDLSRLAVVSQENGLYVIKNVSLQGSLQFRRRIPKPHMMQDNLIEDLMTSFIPLPETKCRHPLFGADYKRAVRLPRALTERLRDSASHSPRKKHKKDKRSSQSLTAPPSPAGPASPATPAGPASPAADAARDGSPKKDKKRKRKRTEPAVEEEELHTKSKRIKLKHDPNSSAAWESEQAIEENLFNF